MSHPPSDPRPRHFLLTTVGTDGDIHPFLNLAVALRDRGHEVTLATHDHFADRAASVGLEFQTIVTDSETDDLVRQSGLWHPFRAPLVVAAWGRRLFRRQHEALSRLASRPGTVLVASPGVVAARVIQETTGTPLVSVVLQPWMLPSLHAPPVMMGGLTLPRRAPRFAGRAYYRLFDHVGSRLIGKEVWRLRARLGLPPVRRVFQWWLSPDRAIGLFPDWFGPPQPDWPAQLRLAGFPLNPRHAGGTMPAGVREFCRAAGPPIAVTFGTGMRQGEALFRASIEACRRLGRRCVLLTPHQEQLPDPLPEGALACAFAPFAELFPRCAAVIHHGGIGTVAQALAAGVPQLIVPLAFDQLDNALRVRELGAGGVVRRRNATGVRLAEALAPLLSPSARETCRGWGGRIEGDAALQKAVEWLEGNER